MRYELTPDLMTGNALIDSEHRQLLAAVNDLMDACSQGKGREKINATVQFLTSYVTKHFGDEERLQQSSKYPAYATHHAFHEKYKMELAQAARVLSASPAPTIKDLGEINRLTGVLVAHIRTEDRRVADHVKKNG